jgi:CheY-like chemotaxis protein
MMKLNFMLIDDNKIDLFVNQKIIEKAVTNANIKTFASANSAINYLKVLESSPRSQTIFAPDIIFLDINMPEMNGFKFLSEFNKLEIRKKKSIKIYMLSSSTNIEDVQKANKQKLCVGFINKPLTSQTIENVIIQYRPFLTLFDYQNYDINLVEMKNRKDRLKAIISKTL